MRIFRALSLDVVLGAACGGLLAEHMTHARMVPGWWVALLAAVWSIYTGDHLLDARREGSDLLSFRHEFHRRHRRPLTALLALAVLTGLIAASTLRPPVRIFGVGLSVAVILYLASAQGVILSGLPKEPIAGALYAAGIWGGPIVMSAAPSIPLIVTALFHAGAAILNLMMIGVFETEADRSQRSRSLALKWGGAFTARLVMTASVILSVIAGAAVLLGFLNDWAVALVLAVQLAVPAILLAVREWASHHERHRTWGDAVFLTGAVPRLLS